MSVRKSVVSPRWLIGCMMAGGLIACGQDAPREPGERAASQPVRASSAESSKAVGVAAEDGEWRIPAKDYASTRYSGLDQITRDNVARLQPAFTFSTGVLRGHEAAPIVAGNTMYVVTPHPNILYALDLSRGGALK